MQSIPTRIRPFQCSAEQLSIQAPHNIKGRPIPPYNQSTDRTNITINTNIGDTERRGENNTTRPLRKPCWRRLLRKGKLIAAKTIQSVVPINWRVKRVDKQEIERYKRCDVEYELVEKRKGLHPILRPVEPHYEPNEHNLSLTGADQCSEILIERRNAEALDILRIDFSSFTHNWLITSQEADILSVNVHEVAEASGQNTIGQNMDEEPLENVVNRFLASYPKRPEGKYGFLSDSRAHSVQPSDVSEATIRDTSDHNIEKEPLESVVDRLLATFPTEKPDVMLKFITDKDISFTRNGLKPEEIGHTSAKEVNRIDNRIISGSRLDKTEEEIHFYYGYASNFKWNFSFMDRKRLVGRGLK